MISFRISDLLMCGYLTLDSEANIRRTYIPNPDVYVSTLHSGSWHQITKVTLQSDICFVSWNDVVDTKHEYTGSPLAIRLQDGLTHGLVAI